MPTVLIIEDDRRIAKMLRRRLKKAGYDVQIAENGKCGIEKLREYQPDLTLMDMHMPVMDGYEATRFLRHHGYTGTIVALTASAMTHDADKSFDAGCDYFIPKPVGLDFEQQLHNILEGQHGKDSDRR
ncbi:response regulator [candidate division KSB3 bacterium]|uniref:Response regulator n=1 Tax=candidate division KSB3 bacterium TaxID=2044937 RepID=A0A9D5Q7M4_9BACT|nr:response regulator [candidate division KSB3 bacterium]MBD3326056.1 response regulator [candidate division KSB3 bacterium]